MRSHRAFLACLIGFLVLYLGYGWQRFSLGLDFTDEGAYLAWPIRTLFGEKPFSSELLTLLRPVEVFLFVPFKLHPEMTLFEFRLMGWIIHLMSFGCLAFYLFRLCSMPVLSCLIASLPLFVSHIFGIASPSYNTLSSDFLLVALSLKGLASLPDSHSRTFEALSGASLFVATFSHPALGLIGAIIVSREILFRKLASNLVQRRLLPSNLGALVFVGCWIALLLYLFMTGVLETWQQRLGIVRALSEKSLPGSPFEFYRELFAFPFIYSSRAFVMSAAAVVALLASKYFYRRSAVHSGHAALALAVIVAAGIVLTFANEPENLTSVLVLFSALLFGALLLTPPRSPEISANAEPRFLMMLSLGSALIYATFTFYFSAHRSWVSGCLGLPFAFATGLALTTRTAVLHAPIARPVIPALLSVAVLCVALSHYDHIQRDARPHELLASFELPKLKRIKSTPARVETIETLYAYLKPRLARGQELLVYDDCPMLYYILDARPAYGLAWAVRYTQSEATLARLDVEFRSRPLPLYAVRTLVDVSQVDWARAPRTRYENYPINETVLANYEVEKTIFPFEIWKLRSPTQPPASD
jgi:hypothetical protein